MTPIITVCAWCPGHDPRDPKHAGVSHGICPTCKARMERELRTLQVTP